MDVSFIVDNHIPAGGIIFQDERPVEVEILYALPEAKVVIESFGGEEQMSISVWDPEVYLDGFRFSECRGMDEAIARATGWKLRYNRLDETREPSIKRVGGIEVRTSEGFTDVSVWNVSITGLDGKIVKLRGIDGEERIYAA